MGDIDFSNEGLGIGAEPVEEAPAVEVPEVESEDAPEVVEETLAEDEAPVEEAPVEDAPVEVEAETPNEWQVRYDEAQKLIGRQGQELGELRKAVEQIQQSQVEPEAAPQIGGWVPTSAEELMDGAADPDFAVQAFNIALEQAPDLLPDVIAETRAHDPALAERMVLAYQEHRIQAQLGPVQETYQQQQTTAAVGNVVEQHAATVENWADIKDEVAAIIAEEPDLCGGGTPEEVARGLKWATRMAQQARAVAAQHAQAQQAAQGIAQRQQAAVETGTPNSAPPVEDMSIADSIRAGIFADDANRRRALEL